MVCTKQANPDPAEEVVLELFQTNSGAQKIRCECNQTLSDPVKKKKDFSLDSYPFVVHNEK